MINLIPGYIHTYIPPYIVISKYVHTLYFEPNSGSVILVSSTIPDINTTHNSLH